MPQIRCFILDDHAAEIVAGRSERQWMNNTLDRYANRCLPLSIANQMGWEFLNPQAFSAEWNGNRLSTDLTFRGDDGADVGHYVTSLFGHGILTIHLGYLIRTDPGVTLWTRGAPNTVKDGIVPLDGIVETDWLNYTFSSNWHFTRPGSIRFEKGEPFCFITPISSHPIEDFEVKIMPLSADPEIEAGYKEYRKLRYDFNRAMTSGNRAANKEGWQKWYTRGTHPSGEIGSTNHKTKLRLHSPIRE